LRPVGGAREALLGDRRPEDVAAQLLECRAIVRGDGDVGVQIEAVKVGLARARRRDPGEARHAADLEDAGAGPRAEGTPPLHGGTRDPGQHQRRLGEGIGRVALLRLAEDATPAQQPENAGPDGGDEPADLRIGGRLGRMKAEAPIGCLGKDPVD